VPEKTAPAETRTTGWGRIARPVTRLFWFGLVPAALSGFGLQALVPNRSQARGNEFLRQVAAAYERFDIAFAVSFFVLATLAVNYWRHHLPGGKYLEPKASPTGRFRTLTLFVGIAAVGALALFVRARVVEAHRVASSSMIPTLLPADRLLTEKFAYGSVIPGSDASRRPPSRGDVIVFPASTRSPQQQHLVKRVLGIPGDHIEVRLGSARINGWKVPSCNAGSFTHSIEDRLILGRIAVEFLGDESYLTIKVPEDTTETKYTVLPGEVFVLGDNRGFSEDSRIWIHGRNGGVPIREIEGRVKRVLFGRNSKGEVNMSRLWAPLGTTLPFDHIDTKALAAGIAACLKIRPQVTLPPVTTASRE